MISHPVTVEQMKAWLKERIEFKDDQHSAICQALLATLQQPRGMDQAIKALENAKLWIDPSQIPNDELAKIDAAITLLRHPENGREDERMLPELPGPWQHLELIQWGHECTVYLYDGNEHQLKGIGPSPRAAVLAAIAKIPTERE